jgi:signal transduction histidine kinase
MVIMAEQVSPQLLPAALAPDPDARRGRRSVRDWVVDVVAFLLSAGWAWLLTWLWSTDNLAAGPVSANPSLADVLVVADLVAGWLATIALWLRRRWPVGLSVAMAIIGLFSFTGAVASIIALFTVAVHRRYQLALVLGAVNAASAVPFFAYRADPLNPQDSFAFSVVAATVITALVVGWGMFVRARRQLVLSLRDRAERAEAEQQLRAEQARHLERERIAREMHDLLAHRISLVSMHAGALEFRSGAPADEIAKSAGVIRESAHQALEELREVIGVLRAPPGAPDRPQPTLADLPALLDDSQRAGVRVRLADELAEPSAVPAATGRTAYRIVQEALTNARKHAGGALVDVRLAGAPGGGLSVTVRNGRPVGAAMPAGAPVPGAGAGLVGLTERASLAGGRLAYGRSPDGGFEVSAWLPWAA